MYLICRGDRGNNLRIFVDVSMCLEPVVLLDKRLCLSRKCRGIKVTGTRRVYDEHRRGDGNGFQGAKKYVPSLYDLAACERS